MTAIFVMIALIALHLQCYQSLYEDTITRVFRFVGIRNKTNYRLVNREYNNAMITAANQINQSFLLFTSIVDEIINNAITDNKAMELKSMYNEYKLNHLFSILSRIPHVITTSWIESNESVSLKKQTLEQLLHALGPNYVKNSTEYPEDKLIKLLSHHLSELSLLLLNVYIHNDPRFNGYLIHYKFLWDYLSFPSLSSSSSSNISMCNSLVDFMDKYGIIIWNPSSQVTFNQSQVNVMEVYLNSFNLGVNALKLRVGDYNITTLLMDLQQYWLTHVSSCSIIWKSVPKYGNVAIYRYIMTEIVSMFIKQSQYAKLEEFLRNLKHNDAIFMLKNTEILGIALLSECDINDWYQILTIFLKYMIHDLDTKEQIVFIQSTYLWQFNDHDLSVIAQYDNLYIMNKVQNILVRYYLFPEQNQYLYEMYQRSKIMRQQNDERRNMDKNVAFYICQVLIGMYLIRLIFLWVKIVY